MPRHTLPVVDDVGTEKRRGTLRSPVLSWILGPTSGIKVARGVRAADRALVLNQPPQQVVGDRQRSGNGRARGRGVRGLRGRLDCGGQGREPRREELLNELACEEADEVLLRRGQSRNCMKIVQSKIAIIPTWLVLTYHKNLAVQIFFPLLWFSNYLPFIELKIVSSTKFKLHTCTKHLKKWPAHIAHKTSREIDATAVLPSGKTN